MNQQCAQKQCMIDGSIFKRQQIASDRGLSHVHQCNVDQGTKVLALKIGQHGRSTNYMSWDDECKNQIDQFELSRVVPIVPRKSSTINGKSNWKSQLRSMLKSRVKIECHHQGRWDQTIRAIEPAGSYDIQHAGSMEISVRHSIMHIIKIAKFEVNARHIGNI